MVQQRQHRAAVADVLQPVQRLQGGGIVAALHLEPGALQEAIGIVGLAVLVDRIQRPLGGREIPPEHFDLETRFERLLVAGIQVAQDAVHDVARAVDLVRQQGDLGILVEPRHVGRPRLRGGRVLLQGQRQRPAGGVLAVQGHQPRPEPDPQLRADVGIRGVGDQFPQGLHGILGHLADLRQIGAQIHDVPAGRVLREDAPGFRVGLVETADEHEGAREFGPEREVLRQGLDDFRPQVERVFVALDQRTGAGQIRFHVETRGIFGDQFLEDFHRRSEAAEAEQVLGIPIADVVVVRFEGERAGQVFVGGGPVAARDGQLREQVVGLGRLGPQGGELPPQVLGLRDAAEVIVAPAEGFPGRFDGRIDPEGVFQQRGGGRVVFFLDQHDGLFQFVARRRLRPGIGGPGFQQERFALGGLARGADQAVHRGGRGDGRGLGRGNGRRRRHQQPDGQSAGRHSG